MPKKSENPPLFWPPKKGKLHVPCGDEAEWNKHCHKERIWRDRGNKKKGECINKWASKAPLRANIPEVPAEAGGGGRRVQTVSFQLQCSIWQHTQSHKQRPQNNGWSDRMSAYITTDREVESKQIHTGFIYLGDKSLLLTFCGQGANKIWIIHVKWNILG